MPLTLHHQFLCPCGVGFGDLTDHPQAERLCLEHTDPANTYHGGVPEYVRGKEFPEGFRNFVESAQAAGQNMPQAAVDYVQRKFGGLPTGATDQEPSEPKLEPAPPEEDDMEPDSDDSSIVSDTRKKRVRITAKAKAKPKAQPRKKK